MADTENVVNDNQNNQGNQEVKPEPKPEPKQESVKAKENSSDSDKGNFLLEKYENLQKDVNTLRSKYKELEKENALLKGENGSFRLEKRKDLALNNALASLGEDFEISKDKELELKELIAEFPDSEVLEDKITKAVNLVKTPKQKGAKIMNTPFLGREPEKPETSDINSLYELAKNNPEAFKNADITKFLKR